MTKKISNRILTAAILMLAFGCNNNDTQRTIDAPKDSVAVAQGGSGGHAAIDSNKNSDTSTLAKVSKKIESLKDSQVVQKINDAVAKVDEKTKAVVKDVATETKKVAHKIDSTIAVKKDELTSAKKNETATAKKESASSSDDEGLLPPSAADNSKSFAPKFGIIPRDANENNINSFKSAFPDKKTLVKINFDADPDAEMTATKTQIIKALKKSGYTNISEKSTTFHPTRMPKDIHYELQRDGSVIIWLQPATAQ